MESKDKWWLQDEYISNVVITEEFLVEVLEDIFTDNKGCNEIKINMKKEDLEYIEKELKNKDMKEYNLEELCETHKMSNKESEDLNYDDPFYSKLSRAERRAYERNLRKNKNKRNNKNKENE